MSPSKTMPSRFVSEPEDFELVSRASDNEDVRECDEDRCPRCGEQRRALAECGGEGGKPGPCPQGDQADDAADLDSRIASLPDADPRFGRGYAKPPFPVESDPPTVGQWIDDKISGKTYLVANDRKYEARTVEVPVDDLIATQEFVSRDGLKKLDKVEKSPLPLVLKHQGKLYLEDGTHRASLAKLKGARTIQVKLFDSSVLGN